MTKREQQYINWNKFMKDGRTNPIKATYVNINGMDCYKAVIPPRKCRVPDWLLKKMPKYD